MADPTVLYARIRNRIDLNDSSYLDDTEIGQLCEESYLDLWDFLIAQLGSEGPWERVDLVTVPGQDFVGVSVDSSVYRLLRLEFAASGGKCYLPVRPLNLASDEISTQVAPFSSADSFRYFARRGSRGTLADRGAGGLSSWLFYFSPVPSAAYTLRMYYIPVPNIQVGEDGVYTNFPDDFPEYVVADVCAKLMDKQEADSAPFVAERERIKSRIERYTTPHEMNGPKLIADMRRLDHSLNEQDSWRRRR